MVTSAVFGSLFMAGLAGSLHCIGMCGPILLGFSQALGPTGRMDWFAYHAGRLWTYALLGFAAGWVSAELRTSAGGFVGQQTLSVIAGLLVIIAGIAAAGWIPGVRFESQQGCAAHASQKRPWLSSLLRQQGLGSRLLLGAVMGFLPCGLIYAVLVMAATLPTPAHSALAMLVFGLGTLPALSAVLLGSHLVPAGLRAHGTRLVAAVLVGTGVFMLARALLMAGHHHHHGMH